MLKSFFFFVISIILMTIIALQFNCTSRKENHEMTKEELLQRGKYLVTVGGCEHCHSPKIFTEMGPESDTTKILSGYSAQSTLPSIEASVLTSGNWILTRGDLNAWVGPWGVSFSANLTPDGPTGLGNWTEEIFIKSMRTGKQMGFGRPILPPMPWQDIGKMSDEDLKAVFTYLKSLKPVNNQVPEPIHPNMMAETLSGKK